MRINRMLYLFLMITPVLIGLAPLAEAAENNRIVYGLTLEPSGFDPHIHQSSELGIVLQQVYDTLIYRDPATKDFVPGLATNWTISEDGLVYTFSLRQDVRFHDGTSFNSEAVATNLDRITDPETLSQRAVFMLGPFERYEIVDQFTIRLILAEPYSPLLDSLSQVYLGIASPTALSEFSDNRYQFHQVGTGPFTFEEFVPGDRIVLRRNISYTWGPEFYQQETGDSLQEIVFRFFTDPPTRALALESSEAHIMGEIMPATARALTGNSSIQLLPTEIPGQPLQFLLNTTRYPTDNVLFRQALLYGTNRNMIVDTVFQGFSPIAWGPVSASTLYYHRALEGMYDFDAQQAAALLSSIGFEDTDENGYLNAGDGDLEVTILYGPWGLTPQTVQMIQDQWREIGIKAVLEPVPGFPALIGAIAEGSYNLVAFNSFGYDPAILTQYFLSDGANNFSNYRNPELDNALLNAVRESNPDARRGLYLQIQQFIMNEALVLPIRDYVNLNATVTSIQGLSYDAAGWFPLLNNVTIVED